MTLISTLTKLVSLLNEAQIPYMLSGSVLSSFYGVQRTTQDMDLVIDPTQVQLKHFISLLEANAFYVSENNALDAFRRKFQFNVVDMETVWKVDLVICKKRAFSKEEFSRRQRQEIFGVPLWVASIEDSILSKLEWSKNTGAERQLNDVEGMFKVQGHVIDLDYLNKWAEKLDLEKQLAPFLQER